MTRATQKIDDTAAVQVSRTEADYDQLPYPSLPVAYSQPAQSAAMLRMFGLDAPNVAQARVLELGCASGGNIIPLAARFPQASFVGVDLSQRHVDDANNRIEQLALPNITIRRADLTEAAFERQSFDYIICHGVFSWVPRRAQDAILRICGESLSTGGVASISYNVLPGWHMRRIIRDICLLHAGTSGAPSRRVAKARKALSDIAGKLSGASPYANLIRSEAQRLAKAPSAYVLGEFLAENNAPCYFSDFAKRARAAQLTYVCEGDLATSLPETFFPAVAKHIRFVANGNPIAVQQHLDLFSGRPFRRSLLMRADRTQATGKVEAENLRDLHFSAGITAVEGRKSERPIFKDAHGATIAPKTAGAAQMLQKLATAYPATLPLEELAAPDTAAPALKALLRMLERGQATAWAHPLNVGGANATAPRAWRLARVEASANQPWATGQNHLAVKMPPPIAALVELMDGSRNRAELLAAFEKALGRDAQHNVTQQFAAALTYCARNGLLEA